MKLPVDPRLPIVRFDELYIRQLNARLYELYREIAMANNAMSDGFLFEMTDVTGDYTATVVDQVLLVDNSAAVTITLPIPEDTDGKRFVVKKVSNNTSTVTVVSSGGALIDNDASQVIISPYTSLDFVSDGTFYWII